MALPDASYTGEIHPITGKALDRVRFLVGDTDVRKPHLFDVEIEGLLAQVADSPDLAAPLAADAIAAKYASKVDYRGGKVARQLSQLYDHYTELAKKLRANRATAAIPWGGGIDKSDRETDRADTSLVQPTFDRGQFANPAAPDNPGSTYNPETDSSN